MKFEMNYSDIFEEEIGEYLKVYIKYKQNKQNKDCDLSFKKQYDLLSKDFVIRCKIVDGEGFIIIKKKDLEKLKDLEKDKIIIGYDEIHKGEIFK
ncbi:MAG: hypothetical protein ACK4ZM_03125 [bacterium]